MLVLACKPTMALSRAGVAPNTVKELAGAAAKAAVIGRPVSATAGGHPRRTGTSSFLSLPMPIELPRSAPMVVRCELVVCCATLRLSDCAPDSLNAFWVVLEIWKRPNGVIVADAGA